MSTLRNTFHPKLSTTFQFSLSKERLFNCTPSPNFSVLFSWTLWWRLYFVWNRKRSRQFSFFRYIYIGDVKLVASLKLKDEKKGKLMEFLNAVHVTVKERSLMYSGKLWSWNDFMGEIKQIFNRCVPFLPLCPPLEPLLAYKFLTVG